MILKLKEKQKIVSEIIDVASKATSAAIVDYRGLTVGEMTNLRSLARKNNIYLRVVRNTLARRAFSDSSYAFMEESCIGPVFLAFSYDDQGAVARLLSGAIKEYGKLSVVAIALSGKLFNVNDLDVIAKLPTYDQSLAVLVSVMKAPIIKLVRTIAEPYSMLTRTIAAIRDKKAA